MSARFRRIPLQRNTIQLKIQTVLSLNWLDYSTIISDNCNTVITLKRLLCARNYLFRFVTSEFAPRMLRLAVSALVQTPVEHRKKISTMKVIHK